MAANESSIGRTLPSDPVGAQRSMSYPPLLGVPAPGGCHRLSESAISNRKTGRPKYVAHIENIYFVSRIGYFVPPRDGGHYACGEPRAPAQSVGAKEPGKQAK